MDASIEKYESVSDTVLFRIGGSLKLEILKRNSSGFGVIEFEIDI
jgi:hypothetical protein